MRLCALLFIAVFSPMLRQSAGKPIGMDDTIADVVSRVLEGSDKEKTEAITLVLQLLAEIDLRSLCKSIGEDPTKMMYVDDVIARAGAESNVSTSGSSSVPEHKSTKVNFSATDTETTTTLGVTNDAEVTATQETFQKTVMTEKASSEAELNATVELASHTNLTTPLETATEADVTSMIADAEQADVTTETPIKADVTTETPIKADVTTETPIKADVTTEAPIKVEVTTETPIKAEVTTETPIKADVTTTLETTIELDVTPKVETPKEAKLPTTEAPTDSATNTMEQSPTEADPTTTAEAFKPASDKPSAIAPSYGASNLAKDNDYIAKIKSLYDDYIGVSDYASPVLFPPNLGYDYYDLGDNFVYDIAAAAASSKVDDVRQFEHSIQNGNEEILHFPDSLLSLKSLASNINPVEDAVYIEESKSLKPKHVLSSDNFQREEDRPLGTEITSQGANQPISSEALSTPSVSSDPQVSQNSSTGFPDDVDNANSVLLNTSDIVMEATPDTSKFSSPSTFVLHDRSENIMNETLSSFETNITQPFTEVLNGEPSFPDSFAMAVLTVSSPSPLSNYTNDRAVLQEETPSAPNTEEIDTTYGETTRQQLAVSDVANPSALNVSDSYSDTEHEAKINVSLDDNVQEKVLAAAADVFPWLKVNPDFLNATAKDTKEENQTLALAASSFTSSTSGINTLSNVEVDDNNKLANDTYNRTTLAPAEEETAMKNEAHISHTTLLQFTTDATTPLNYTSNFTSDKTSNKPFNVKENEIAKEISEYDYTSSEKEPVKIQPSVLPATQVSLESEGSYVTSENLFVDENISSHFTTQTTFSTSHASPTIEATVETTADTSKWILDSQKPDSTRRQPPSSLSRTLEQHLGHMTGAHLKRKSEDAISSEVFSRWSGQEIQDRWSLIGKKREGTSANEVASHALERDEHEAHRDVQYKFNPMSVEKDWGKLTDTRTYEPRWDSKKDLVESHGVPETTHKTVSNPEGSTTVTHTVSFSDDQPDKTRVEGDTLPPGIRQYSSKTWSPFNPHFASPNLGSLWGLSPNFQHQDAPHHLVRQKVKDLGSYPEFQFGRPSPWRSTGNPSDIGYQVKNKPKVSSEVLRTLGVRQKTILSEETLPKFLHYNGYLCPGLFGYFGDVMDCRSFFICSWGVPYRFYCPSGTLWNPVESVCDWSRNVKCGKK